MNFNAGSGYYSHVYAAAGYVCLLPNYRGSTGYGSGTRWRSAAIISGSDMTTS